MILHRHPEADPEACARRDLPIWPDPDPTEAERLPVVGLMLIAFGIAAGAITLGWTLRGWWGA